MTPHALGSSSLARVGLECGDLHRSSRTGRGIVPGHGHDDRVGIGHDPGPDDRVRRTHTGDSATQAPLRPNRRQREVQQRGSSGDETQLPGIAVCLYGTDHLVVALERDDLPAIPAEQLRIHSLDHAMTSAQCQLRAAPVQAHDCQRAFSSVQVDEIGEGGSSGHRGCRRRGGKRHQVDCACSDQTSCRGDDTELAASRGTCCRGDDVMVGARAILWQWVDGVDTGQVPSGRHEDPARLIGYLQRDVGCGDAGGPQQDRPSRGAVLLGDGRELVGDDLAQLVVGRDDPGVLGYLAAELVLLRLQLDAGELGEPTQLHVEDVIGLGLVQIEGLHEALPSRRRVVGGSDDGDDLVDVDDGQQQSFDEVQTFLRLPQAKFRTP